MTAPASPAAPAHTLEEQARALLPTLSEAQRNAVRMLAGQQWRGPAPSHRTYDVLRRIGVLPERTGGFQRGVLDLTDIGRAVAALLAS